MTDEKDQRWEKGTELLDTLFGRKPEDLPWPARFTEYTIAHLFGDVWQRGSLDMQERSFATCAVLVALGREAEQRSHFKGARNLGIPREKLVDLITHVAHYGGWPVAVSAMRNLNDVWPDESTDSPD
ncbi:MAG: carboxymuconolactone decarboxylase family protein [Pseudomonadota bacterium]